MNWHEYPILRLVVPLIIGILFYFHFPQWAPPMIFNIVFLLIIAFLAWPKKYIFPYKHRYISGLAIYIAFVFWGISLTQYQHAFYQHNYFGNHIANTTYSMATIVEPPLVKQKSVKLIVEVRKMGDEKSFHLTRGTAILYLEKDSLSEHLQYGDVLLFKNNFKRVEAPQNPDQFDYRMYLNRNGIEYQLYLKSGAYRKTDERKGNILKSWAIKIRQHLLHELQMHNIKDAEFSVTAAMLLGVRNYLSTDLRQAFAGAGAMHILCVSGLHVGIVFMILNYILGFLDGVQRGRLWKTIIILLSIWSYAMITALSPSVVRAASMFTFISIGQNLGRQVNVYNSLAASAFVLLAVNPYFIFDLGFQLSYTAVIAIVALQKPLQDLWTPKWNIAFKVWQLICVSLAAQIGTAPLSLYYFHSFPNFFLLTNLVVIPAAFIIFISGVMVLLFSWAGPLADYFGWLLSKMVALLNYFITTVEKWPWAVSQYIFISKIQLVLLILLALFVSIMFIFKKPKLVFINLSLIILFLVADIKQRKTPHQFIVYQTNKYDYISFNSQGQEIVLTDADVVEHPDLVDFQTKEHRIRLYTAHRKLYDINKQRDIVFPHLFIYKQFAGFHDLRFAIINSNMMPPEFDSTVKVDYIIISGNPNIKMEKLLNVYDCNHIVFASSNSNWNIKKWNKDLKRLDKQVYNVKERGAFVLNID